MGDEGNQSQTLSNASTAHENAPDATEKTNEIRNALSRSHGVGASRKNFRIPTVNKLKCETRGIHANVSNKSRAHENAPDATEKTDETMNTIHGVAGVGKLQNKLPETNAASDEMRDTRKKQQTLSNNSRSHENAPDATEKTEEPMNTIHGFTGFGNSEMLPETNAKNDEMRHPRIKKQTLERSFQRPRKCARRH